VVWVYTLAVMRFIMSLAALQEAGLATLPKMVVYWSKCCRLDPAGAESGYITLSPPFLPFPQLFTSLSMFMFLVYEDRRIEMFGNFHGNEDHPLTSLLPRTSF
jgi:hypothetical protein